MVDPSQDLGRCVVTARETLEVIRPYLRVAMMAGLGCNAGLAVDPAGCMVAPEDENARDAIYNALADSALSSVKQWAGDFETAKVFDGDAMRAFIDEALHEAFMGVPSEALLDVLSLDGDAFLAQVREMGAALLPVAVGDFNPTLLP